MTTNCSANWLKTDEDNIFYWLHTPQQNIKNTAIIIIGPIGPEYMPCHRSIKLLAQTLTQSGFHSIRYDPIAMGNSSGQLNDTNLWDKWTHTPKQFTQFLSGTLNIDNVILIGLRSGCLVLSEALKEVSANHAVFWHPLLRGSTFIRSIQLLDSVLYETNPIPTDKTLEGGGYPFIEELQNKIKSVNLINKDDTKLKTALVINDSQSSNNSKLAGKLTAIGVKTDSIYLDGLDNMVKQVTLSKIPHSNLTAIQNWLNKLNIAATENTNKHDTPCVNFTHSHFIETTTAINSEHKLFGILTTPTHPTDDKIILFVNTGAAHHAGPNRIHVDVARIMAKNGIATLRFDLGNLGDSATTYIPDPPQEYPRNAATDINRTIHYASTILHKKNIVLCGISAGAHNIFHAALESQCNDISQLILINPETFYWNPNQSVFSSENSNTEIDQVYYQQQIYNYKKWLALITNPAKLYNTSLFVIIFIYKKIKYYFLRFLTLLHLNFKSRLEKDLILLASRKISIDLIYSENDPGQKILMSQAGRTIKNNIKNNLYSSIQIKSADHTFSSVQSRNKLYKALIDCTSKKIIDIAR